MLSKKKIKLIQSLRLPKYRRAHRLFTAEGSRLVLDFLAEGGGGVKELYALPEWLAEYGRRFSGVPHWEITGQEMKKISNLKNPSEVLALVAMPGQEEEAVPGKGKWSLALDGIRDPGNLGTIIRTAEWFGIDKIFCSPDTVDVFNPKVVQATMGSLARVSVVYADLEKLLKKKPGGVPVYGTLLQGVDVHEMKNPEKGIVLIGSEAHGISGGLLPLIDYKITVPAAPHSKAESLNASIAAAVVCYALMRG